MLFTFHRHFEPEEVQFHPSTSHISGAALLVFCVLEWYYNGCMNLACLKPRSDSDIHKSCEFLFCFVATGRRLNVLTMEKRERTSFVLFTMGCPQFSIKRLKVSRCLPCRKVSTDYDCPLSYCVILCRPVSSHVKMSSVCVSNDVSITALLSLY